MRRLPVFAAMAAAFIAVTAVSPAAAQYAWIDEKGIKQFSDKPPPPSVPASRILKQPGRTYKPEAQEDTPAPTQPTKTEMTVAEKNAEFRKRRAEQAEKEKKAADEARMAAGKAKHCDSALAYKRALESGQRIAHTDASGERAYLTDQQREREMREVNQTLEDCK